VLILGDGVELGVDVGVGETYKLARTATSELASERL
jgi:hypothetical protein